MTQDLKQAAEQAVFRASAKGASAADVFIREEEKFSVTVRMGEVETLKEAVSRGMRLRVFVGKADGHVAELRSFSRRPGKAGR